MKRKSFVKKATISALSLFGASEVVAGVKQAQDDGWVKGAYDEWVVLSGRGVHREGAATQESDECEAALVLRISKSICMPFETVDSLLLLADGRQPDLRRLRPEHVTERADNIVSFIRMRERTLLGRIASPEKVFG